MFVPDVTLSLLERKMEFLSGFYFWVLRRNPTVWPITIQITPIIGSRPKAVSFFFLVCWVRQARHKNDAIKLTPYFTVSHFASTSTNLCFFITSCAAGRNIQQVRRYNTWGKFFVASTLLSMDKTNAAVFPVPDCDWAIILFGLNIKQKSKHLYNCHLTPTKTPPKHVAPL